MAYQGERLRSHHNNVNAPAGDCPDRFGRMIRVTITPAAYAAIRWAP
jgi:hypothetical protein